MREYLKVSELVHNQCFADDDCEYVVDGFPFLKDRIWYVKAIGSDDFEYTFRETAKIWKCE